MPTPKNIIIKYRGVLFFVFIFVVIGLIGAILADRSFAGPIGGMVGASLGLLIAAYETISTPKGARRIHFTTYVRSGIPGGYSRQDSRVVTTLMMAILGAFSSILWQIVLCLF